MTHVMVCRFNPEYFYNRQERGDALEIVNNDELLESFIQRFQIREHFSVCNPSFFLLHYRAGEMLTSPFTPSQYLQFIVKGDLLLYDMPNEDSTVALQTSHQGVRLIGDMELLDIDFIPFFVEAKSEVYTVAVRLDQNRKLLLTDPMFLQCVCRDLAAKLRGATDVSMHIELKDRLAAFLNRVGVGYEIRGVARFAEQLNVSERQLIRTMKTFCEAGWLRHEKAGLYRVVRCPGGEKPTEQI